MPRISFAFPSCEKGFIGRRFVPDEIYSAEKKPYRTMEYTGIS
jgi:hypothetical protein